MITSKAYLSVGEVAKRFGVNNTTVYRLVQRGMLPGLKIGGQWRFNEEMLQSWVVDRVTIERMQREGYDSHLYQNKEGNGK